MSESQYVIKDVSRRKYLVINKQYTTFEWINEITTKTARFGEKQALEMLDAINAIFSKNFNLIVTAVPPEYVVYYQEEGKDPVYYQNFDNDSMFYKSVNWTMCIAKSERFCEKDANVLAEGLDLLLEEHVTYKQVIA